MKKSSVMIYSTSKTKDRYDAIKTYCCVENTVPSQAVLVSALRKSCMLMSVYAGASSLTVCSYDTTYLVDFLTKNAGAARPATTASSCDTDDDFMMMILMMILMTIWTALTTRH